MITALVVASLILVALHLLAEAAYWLGYRAAQDNGGTGSCAVLVLGFPTNKDGSHHPAQRLRVEAGYAVYQANRSSRIILSGGAVKNAHVEAESMAEIARALGVPKRHIVIEDRARTTWENIGCTAPYMAEYERIIIVSDSLHVHRAKHYARRQIPWLCQKISIVGAYEPLSLSWWKVPVAANELRAWIRDFIVYGLAKAGNAAVTPPVKTMQDPAQNRRLQIQETTTTKTAREIPNEI